MLRYVLFIQKIPSNGATWKRVDVTIEENKQTWVTKFWNNNILIQEEVDIGQKLTVYSVKTLYAVSFPSVYLSMCLSDACITEK